MSIRWNDSEVSEILKLYQDGLGCVKISEHFHCSASAIKNVLKKNNVPFRTVSEAKKQPINEKDKETLVYHYVTLKQGLVSSGKAIGVSQKKAKSILESCGVKIRTYEESKQLTRRYKIDDNFFKTQNRNMAYILGLIASDGNVAKKENQIGIQLLSKDKDILEKIKEVTKSSRPLDRYITKDGKDTTKFAIHSAEWKKDLANYGIVPAKTFNLTPPFFLRPSYRIDYIRGYFDGDGCITFGKHGTSPSWSIVGASYSVVSWIRETLANDYGIITNSIETSTLLSGKKMYRITYYGFTKIKSIYNALYTDSPLFLQRKKEKFQTILNVPRDSMPLD